MKHLKIIASVVAIGALAIPAVAAASGEQSQIQFAPGTFSISATTCKFVHVEAEKPMGTSWAVGKVWAAYEDARHDQKMACNTARQTRVIACFAKPIPPVVEKADHGAGKPGDEKGAAAAIGVIQDIQTCVLEAGGLAP
jgi:hypothetical protein